MTMAPSRKFQVLLVEDNEADVFLLRKALGEAGLHFDFTVIDNAADAVRFIGSFGLGSKSVVPDLAVIDLNLLASSGIDVLSSLRANMVLAGLPVCVLTSSNAPRDRAQVSQLGVSCFLVKPPDLEGMLQVGTALKRMLLESPGGSTAA
jgi:chemotaxis family two-component system response regulator Rcp1